MKKTALTSIVALSTAFALAACAPPHQNDSDAGFVDTATVGAKTPKLEGDGEATTSETQYSIETDEQSAPTNGREQRQGRTTSRHGTVTSRQGTATGRQGTATNQQGSETYHQGFEDQEPQDQGVLVQPDETEAGF